MYAGFIRSADLDWDHLCVIKLIIHKVYVYHRVDRLYYISRDEPDSPLTQYITNAGITRTRYTITLFKHHHPVLWQISNQISV